MSPAQREQTLHNLVLFYHEHHHKTVELHDNEISCCFIEFTIDYKYLHNILQSNFIYKKGLKFSFPNVMLKKAEALQVTVQLNASKIPLSRKAQPDLKPYIH